MQWPVPCTASSYLKAVTVHKKESNSESSVFRWEKEKLCAGLTREIKSQKSSKNHQKKAVKEKVDVRVLADNTSPDEWMDGWTDSPMKRKKEPLQSVPLNISRTHDDPRVANSRHGPQDPPARHWVSTPMLRLSSPTVTHRSAQTPAWAATAHLFPSFPARSGFCFLTAIKVVRTERHFRNTHTQTCTHAYSLVLSQTHGRTKNQLGLS